MGTDSRFKRSWRLATLALSSLACSAAWMERTKAAGLVSDPESQAANSPSTKGNAISLALAPTAAVDPRVEAEEADEKEQKNRATPTPEPSPPGPAQPLPARAQATQPAAPAAAPQRAGTFKGAMNWAPPDDDYVIGPQDLIAVNVWREPELSRAVPVRPDGKISLPLVGEVVASGLTPQALQTRIAKELEGYVHKPVVTVIVQEANSHRFSIIGEVQRPGSYMLTANMTVLDALAAAGGLRDFAKARRIYLLRRMPDGSRTRIPFDYKEAVHGRAFYREVELLPGDTIVVP